MDDWDADDFEPPPPAVTKEPEKGQWDDEDKEDESVKESWEQDETTSSTAKPKVEKKKKKSVEQKSVAESEVLEDPIAEKLRRQRLVEEADFNHTKELFGGNKEGRSLDDFVPKTETEFMEYAEMVAAKILPFEKSFHFLTMLKAFMRKATAGLTATDAKEISSAMSVIANEKLKIEKDAAAGKKKSGAKKKQLMMDKPEDDDFRGGGGGGGFAGDDDYEFM